MNAEIFDSLLSHPLGLLVATVIVAVVTSVVTVRMMTARPAAAPAPVRAASAPAADAGDDPALIAAITAAVYATIGSHRIIYIGASGPSTGSSWTTATRTQHHTSHALTRPRPSND